MISQFAKLPSKPRFFLCHPAPIPNGKGKYGQHEKGILEKITMIDKIAQDEKAGVIDVHGVFKDHPELFADNLHPNDAGATVLAKTVYKALTGNEFTGADPVVAAPAPAVKKEKK